MSSPYTYDSSKIEFVGGIARLKIPNTSATILVNEVFQFSAFTSLAETVNKSGSDDIQYQMKVSGSLMYWNGSAWVSSDASFSQSNSVSTINTNAATLIAGSNKTLQVQIILKGSGATSPEIDKLVIKGSNGPVFNPASGKCSVFAYLRDILGDELTALGNSPKLVAVNEQSFFNDGHLVPRFYMETPFADTDFGILASLDLTITETTNNKIRFMVTYLPYGVPSKVETIRLNASIVPNQTQVDLVDLTSVDHSQLL